MGTAASTLIDNPEDSALDNHLRDEMTELFMSEFQKMKDATIDDEEIKATFTERLIAKEREIISRREEILEKMQTKVLALSKEKKKNGFSDIGSLVMKKMAHLKQKQSLTFLVAVDGSDSADVGFTNVLSMRKPHDNIILYHSYHPGSQESKPSKNKMSAVKIKYEAALIGNLPTENYFLCLEELAHNDSEREMVTTTNFITSTLYSHTCGTKSNHTFF